MKIRRSLIWRFVITIYGLAHERCACANQSRQRSLANRVQYRTLNSDGKKTKNDYSGLCSPKIFVRACDSTNNLVSHITHNHGFTKIEKNLLHTRQAQDCCQYNPHLPIRPICPYNLENDKCSILNNNNQNQNQLPGLHNLCENNPKYWWALPKLLDLNAFNKIGTEEFYVIPNHIGFGPVLICKGCGAAFIPCVKNIQKKQIGVQHILINNIPVEQNIIYGRLEYPNAVKITKNLEIYTINLIPNYLTVIVTVHRVVSTACGEELVEKSYPQLINIPLYDQVQSNIVIDSCICQDKLTRYALKYLLSCVSNELKEQTNYPCISNVPVSSCRYLPAEMLSVSIAPDVHYKPLLNCGNRISPAISNMPLLPTVCNNVPSTVIPIAPTPQTPRIAIAPSIWPAPETTASGTPSICSTPLVVPKIPCSYPTVKPVCTNIPQSPRVCSHPAPSFINSIPLSPAITTMAPCIELPRICSRTKPISESPTLLPCYTPSQSIPVVSPRPLESFRIPKALEAYWSFIQRSPEDCVKSQVPLPSRIPVISLPKYSAIVPSESIPFICMAPESLSFTKAPSLSRPLVMPLISPITREKVSSVPNIEFLPQVCSDVPKVLPKLTQVPIPTLVPKKPLSPCVSVTPKCPSLGTVSQTPRFPIIPLAPRAPEILQQPLVCNAPPPKEVPLSTRVQEINLLPVCNQMASLPLSPQVTRPPVIPRWPVQPAIPVSRSPIPAKVCKAELSPSVCMPKIPLAPVKHEVMPLPEVGYVQHLCQAPELPQKVAIIPQPLNIPTRTVPEIYPEHPIRVCQETPKVALFPRLLNLQPAPKWPKIQISPMPEIYPKHQKRVCQEIPRVAPSPRLLNLQLAPKWQRIPISPLPEIYPEHQERVCQEIPKVAPSLRLLDLHSAPKWPRIQISPTVTSHQITPKFQIMPAVPSTPREEKNHCIPLNSIAPKCLEYPRVPIAPSFPMEMKWPIYPRLPAVPKILLPAELTCLEELPTISVSPTVCSAPLQPNITEAPIIPQLAKVQWPLSVYTSSAIPITPVQTLIPKVPRATLPMTQNMPIPPICPMPEIPLIRTTTPTPKVTPCVLESTRVNLPTPIVIPDMKTQPCLPWPTTTYTPKPIIPMVQKEKIIPLLPSVLPLKPAMEVSPLLSVPRTPERLSFIPSPRVCKTNLLPTTLSVIPEIPMPICPCKLKSPKVTVPPLVPCLPQSPVYSVPIPERVPSISVMPKVSTAPLSIQVPTPSSSVCPTPVHPATPCIPLLPQIPSKPISIVRPTAPIIPCVEELHLLCNDVPKIPIRPMVPSTRPEIPWLPKAHSSSASPFDPNIPLYPQTPIVPRPSPAPKVSILPQGPCQPQPETVHTICRPEDPVTKTFPVAPVRPNISLRPSICGVPATQVIPNLEQPLPRSCVQLPQVIPKVPQPLEIPCIPKVKTICNEIPRQPIWNNIPCPPTVCLPLSPVVPNISVSPLIPCTTPVPVMPNHPLPPRFLSILQLPTICRSKMPEAPKRPEIIISPPVPKWPNIPIPSIVCKPAGTPVVPNLPLQPIMPTVPSPLYTKTPSTQQIPSICALPKPCLERPALQHLAPARETPKIPVTPLLTPTQIQSIRPCQRSEQTLNVIYPEKEKIRPILPLPLPKTDRPAIMPRTYKTFVEKLAQPLPIILERIPALQPKPCLEVKSAPQFNQMTPRTPTVSVSPVYPCIYPELPLPLQKPAMWPQYLREKQPITSQKPIIPCIGLTSSVPQLQKESEVLERPIKPCMESVAKPQPMQRPRTFPIVAESPTSPQLLQIEQVPRPQIKPVIPCKELITTRPRPQIVESLPIPMTSSWPRTICTPLTERKLQPLQPCNQVKYEVPQPVHYTPQQPIMSSESKIKPCSHLPLWNKPLQEIIPMREVNIIPQPREYLPIRPEVCSPQQIIKPLKLSSSKPLLLPQFSTVSPSSDLRPQNIVMDATPLPEIILMKAEVPANPLTRLPCVTLENIPSSREIFSTPSPPVSWIPGLSRSHLTPCMPQVTKICSQPIIKPEISVLASPILPPIVSIPLVSPAPKYPCVQSAMLPQLPRMHSYPVTKPTLPISPTPLRHETLIAQRPLVDCSPKGSPIFMPKEQTNPIRPYPLVKSKPIAGVSAAVRSPQICTPLPDIPLNRPCISDKSLSPVFETPSLSFRPQKISPSSLIKPVSASKPSIYPCINQMQMPVLPSVSRSNTYSPISSPGALASGIRPEMPLTFDLNQYPCQPIEYTPYPIYKELMHNEYRDYVNKYLCNIIPQEVICLNQPCIVPLNEIYMSNIENYKDCAVISTNIKDINLHVWHGKIKVLKPKIVFGIEYIPTVYYMPICNERTIFAASCMEKFVASYSKEFIHQKYGCQPMMVKSNDLEPSYIFLDANQVRSSKDRNGQCHCLYSNVQLQ